MYSVFDEAFSLCWFVIMSFWDFGAFPERTLWTTGNELPIIILRVRRNRKHQKTRPLFAWETSLIGLYSLLRTCPRAPSYKVDWIISNRFLRERPFHMQRCVLHLAPLNIVTGGAGVTANDNTYHAWDRFPCKHWFPLLVENLTYNLSHIFSWTCFSFVIVRGTSWSFGIIMKPLKNCVRICKGPKWLHHVTMRWRPKAAPIVTIFIWFRLCRGSYKSPK